MIPDMLGRWVGEPAEITEASGSDGPEPPPKFWGATLQCVPFYTDWSVYDRVDVYDDAIIPGSTFELDTIVSAPECKVTEEYGFSAPVAISTASEWGDVVGDCGVTPCTVPDGVVDFEDITAVVEKFQSDPDAPIKSRADVINSNVTDPEPDRIVDFLDVTFCVDAFRGFPEGNSYPGPNMGDFDCPPYYGDCYADIRVDSNNDGDIDDFDEVLEDYDSVIVDANWDDDDDSGFPDMDEAPVVGEDDLAEIRLTAACDDVLPELAWWSVSWEDLEAPIKVWRDSDKSGDEVLNGTTGTKYYDWPPPESLWLESLADFGEIVITFEFYDGTRALRMFGDPPPTRTDTVKASEPDCHYGCPPKKRCYASGTVNGALIGAEGIITSRPTALCSGRTTRISKSSVWVGVAADATCNEKGLIWAQVGYSRRKLPGSDAVFAARFIEVQGCPTDAKDKRFLETIPTGPHHYSVLLERATGIWILEIDHGADGQHWVSTENTRPIWRERVGSWASWAAELNHREDQMVGTAQEPCLITLCKTVDINTHTHDVHFIPALVKSDDDTEWRIEIDCPPPATECSNLKIWDLNPQGAKDNGCTSE